LPEYSKKQLQAYTKNKRVLLVEDNRQSREILKSILKDSFSFVVVARNGVDALNVYQKYKFDLVVTDIQMPYMDGIELCKKIKDINSEQHILVISSDDDINHIIELIDIGIDSFIKKPISVDIINKKILKILEHKFFKEEIDKFKQDKAIKEYLQSKNLEYENSNRKKVVDIKRCQILESIEPKDIVHSDSEYSAYAFIHTLETKNIDIDTIVQNLIEYISDLEEIISTLLVRGIRVDTLDNLASIFSKIYNEILFFTELSSIADEIFAIYEFFSSYSSNSIDEMSIEQKEIFDFSEYILEDIKSFVLNVFIEQNVDDIRTYASMLRNSLEQIKIRMSGDSIDNEEIEFF
jgi:DNA-binding NarL/FixJ family response regulator